MDDLWKMVEESVVDENRHPTVYGPKQIKPNDLSVTESRQVIVNHNGIIGK